jgi:NADH-quinone oxidoreductase subunit J
MSGLVAWIVFVALAGTAVVMAAGMQITMSMYRAGLALMSSFLALAGLFVLLDADLLAVMQIMMNVGGMMVMILFMVMEMMDPGGEAMWNMKRRMRMRGPGALSMRMPAGASQAGDEGGIGGHRKMMAQMAMVTAQLPWAAGIGLASAGLLVLLVLEAPWPLAATGPSQAAPLPVGELLLSRYMIAFEGAAFLILAGVAGAVILGRREQGDGGGQ